MSGCIVTCAPPGGLTFIPNVARGTYWRCDCGTLWKAGWDGWRTVGWRSRRRMVAAHSAHVLAQQHLTPTDMDWLNRMSKP